MLESHVTIGMNLSHFEIAIRYINNNNESAAS